MIWPLVVLAGALAGAARFAAARRAERAYAARRSFASDGVALGAEGFTLQGSGERALLLLHGSGDTPQTLRFLGDRLHDEGFTVRAPLLPGHGRRLRDFATATADDYVQEARRELHVLHAQYRWVGIIGLSMGGALGARLAAEDHDVRALVLLAPYLAPPPSVALVGRFATVWSLIVPYFAGRGDDSVRDPEARVASYAYGFFPPNALRALCRTAAAGRRALASITAPTLVVNSREDNRIPAALAEKATATLRGPTERHWVTGCGHVITVDYCRDAVASLVSDFHARHVY
jgi:carboxylesterase